VSAPDTQQSPPPPPPPSGSPFGRFLTSPVLLVGVIALVVGFAALRSVGKDGATSAEPVPGEEGLAGTWSATGTALPVSLELADDGTGTLTRGGCTGSLAPVRAGAETAVLAYTDTSGEPECPRRTRIRVTLVDADTLRVVERRRGRLQSSGTLRRAA
jgi:hypothetical protein